MVGQDSNWEKWLRHLVDGDDQTVREFWQQYGQRLQRLAARHLSPRLQRREAPEDVVQSVCRTFFRRARAGQFRFGDSGCLWRLLCAITVAKTREKTRFHLRQRRSCRRERQLAAAAGDSLPDMAQFAVQQPGPAEAAALADQMERLVAELDDQQRTVFALKLEERSNREIAGQLRCSERTVRRLSQQLQSRLRRILEESALGC